MGIELTITDQQPTVNRNRVFVTRLEISQAHQTNDAVLPLYRVHIEYLRYGVDAQGIRHYCLDYHEVMIKDFLEHAMAKAAAGDMSLVSALQAIEGAVAAIVADDLNTTANVI